MANMFPNISDTFTCMHEFNSSPKTKPTQIFILFCVFFVGISEARRPAGLEATAENDRTLFRALATGASDTRTW